jgi:hypothetical protein
MKKSEYYQNLYPDEDICPNPDEETILEIVKDDDYTITVDEVYDICQIGTCVNKADAVYFFKLGLTYAKSELRKRLKSVEKI